jgi:hypothetical protein
METAQGNSLCSYLYLKHDILLFLCFIFFLLKIREEEGGAGSEGDHQYDGEMVG